jgi:hypothetical protein
VIDALLEVRTDNPDRAKFRVEGASPFARRCLSCNAETPSNAKFCLECGKAFDGDHRSDVTEDRTFHE